MTFEEWWEQVEAYGLGLPEGYVLVPKEPTEKMINAFWNAVEIGNEAKLIDVFTAMIKAAQEEE